MKILSMKTKRIRPMWIALFLGLFTAAPGQAFYSPSTGRWISRDPLGDRAFFSAYAAGKAKRERASIQSASLAPSYVLIRNEPITTVDSFGLDRWLVIVPVHTYLIIDRWDAKCCRMGQLKIDFRPANSWYEILALTGVTVPGRVDIDPHSGDAWTPVHRSTQCAEDREALAAVELMQRLSPNYNISGELPDYNCLTFALTAFFY